MYKLFYLSGVWCYHLNNYWQHFRSSLLLLSDFPIFKPSCLISKSPPPPTGSKIISLRAPPQPWQPLLIIVIFPVTGSTISFSTKPLHFCYSLILSSLLFIYSSKIPWVGIFSRLLFDFSHKKRLESMNYKIKTLIWGLC